jgi:hypothetical protein
MGVLPVDYDRDRLLIRVDCGMFSIFQMTLRWPSGEPPPWRQSSLSSTHS